MVGVLSLEGNVSKGLVTTTSAFAPGIMKDENIARLIPYRLELKGRDERLQWLAAVAAKGK
jgi:restriction system protein